MTMRMGAVKVFCSYQCYHKLLFCNEQSASEQSAFSPHRWKVI